MKVDLHNDEQIITTFRRHWIIFALEIIGLIVLFFLPLIFSAALPQALTAGGAVYFFIAVWMLMLWMRAFVVWFKYYFDVWVVTNHRLIDIEQISLFNRKVSTLDPEHIEDITIHIEGFWKSIFGFGDLVVQTAAHTQEFIMRDIKNPDEAKQRVYETMQSSKDIERRKFAEELKPAEVFQNTLTHEQPNEVTVDVFPQNLPVEKTHTEEENHILSYYKNN
jgi:hypothetical protein